jgi:hypothetical protein
MSGAQIGGGSVVPLDDNGGVPMNPQDQTTEPVPGYFAKEVSAFTLAANTGVSTEDVLVRQFAANPGHLIEHNPGDPDELLLLDRVANRSFYCHTTPFTGDTIKIDRPIDHNFLYSGDPPIPALGKIVTTEMSVDGSTTPQRFEIRAGAIPTDHISLVIRILSAAQPDFSKFGDQDALVYGLCLRIVNGFQRTIFNFHTIGEMYDFGADVNIVQKAGGGEWATTAKILLKDNLGVALRIETGDVLQLVVQDAITQSSLKCAMGAHLTQGER